MSLLFLPFSLQVTVVKSPSSLSVACVLCMVSPELLRMLVSSLSLTGAEVSLLCISVCLTGGGIEAFSRASSHASIFVSTVAMRATVSGCPGVSGGMATHFFPSRGVRGVSKWAVSCVASVACCPLGVDKVDVSFLAGVPGCAGMGLSLSVIEFGTAKVFSFGCGVGGGSAHNSCRVGVNCRPFGAGTAGDAELVLFATHGRLTLVGMGVSGVSWGMFGIEPEAVRLHPAVCGGVGEEVSSLDSWRPSFSAVSMK